MVVEGLDDATSLQTMGTTGAINNNSIDTFDNSLNLNSTLSGNGGSKNLNGMALDEELDEQEAMMDGLDGGKSVDSTNSGKKKKKKKKTKKKEDAVVEQEVIDEDGETLIDPDNRLPGINMNPAFLAAHNKKKSFMERLSNLIPDRDDLINFKHDLISFIPQTHALTHAERQRGKWKKQDARNSSGSDGSPEGRKRERKKGTLERSVDVNKVEPYKPALRFRERMDSRYEKFNIRKDEVLSMVEDGLHKRPDMVVEGRGKEMKKI